MRRILLIAAVYIGAGAILPFSATHRLSGACTWLPDGPHDPAGLSQAVASPADDVKRIACLHRKGAKANPLFVHRFLRHWPSKRQIAKWEAGYDRPLYAKEPARSIQARDSR